ncbi:MAG: hypothetical protein U9R25_00370 [Chloroflexota bacterium]|nr:hypothetical protein [Chloroflexota bacterium]
MTNNILEQGKGILRLAPTWVPRVFCIPGRRIKLHPNDYYAFGAHRGGIDERWLSSTTRADNGPLTTPNEGLSYAVSGENDDPQRVLLADLVADEGAELLGEAMWQKHGGWPIYSKFFDNKGPLPHHMHQMEEHAANVGQKSKPEAYFFPPQLNNYGADFPHTFFGLEPGTSKEQVIRCLEIWNEGDNRITDLSRAYRLETGTGWYIPPGLLHAPGSLCTYEPQWASDIYAMFESMTNDMPIGWEQLVMHVPEKHKQDMDYIISMLDWEINTIPDFKAVFFRNPLPVKPPEEMKEAGYVENWITYGNEYFAAKELTVLPGRTVTIRDSGPYGLIVVQGHGSMGTGSSQPAAQRWPIETPALIRFGQLTYDEYFVSYRAAQEGVTIHNPSGSDPIVMLKHLGPGSGAP